MSIAQTSTVSREMADRQRKEPAPPFAIERLANGQLAVCRDGTATAVKVRLCFPWSSPGRYISLRDEKNNEVALINDLAELDGTARATIEQALAEAGFLFEILRVESQLEPFRDPN